MKSLCENRALQRIVSFSAHFENGTLGKIRKNYLRYAGKIFPPRNQKEIREFMGLTKIYALIIRDGLANNLTMLSECEDYYLDIRGH